MSGKVKCTRLHKCEHPYELCGNNGKRWVVKLTADGSLLVEAKDVKSGGGMVLIPMGNFLAIKRDDTP